MADTEKNEKRFSLNVPIPLHTRFKSAVAANQETMQAVLIRCMERYTEEFEKGKS